MDAFTLRKNKIMENDTTSLSLEEMLEKLPNNLMLTRNSDAPEHDRWRLTNSLTKETLKITGAPTAGECMRNYLLHEEAVRREWIGRSSK